jgi:hypothetical protein
MREGFQGVSVDSIPARAQNGHSPPPLVSLHCKSTDRFGLEVSANVQAAYMRNNSCSTWEEEDRERVINKQIQVRIRRDATPGIISRMR